MFIKDSVDAVLVSQGVIADSVQRVLHRPSSLVKGLQRCTLRSGSHSQIYYTVLPSRSEDPAYIQVRYKLKNDKYLQYILELFLGIYCQVISPVYMASCSKRRSAQLLTYLLSFVETAVENREGFSSI